jgi:hypothetical protein
MADKTILCHIKELEQKLLQEIHSVNRRTATTAMMTTDT